MLVGMNIRENGGRVHLMERELIFLLRDIGMYFFIFLNVNINNIDSHTHQHTATLGHGWMGSPMEQESFPTEMGSGTKEGGTKEKGMEREHITSK